MLYFTSNPAITQNDLTKSTMMITKNENNSYDYSDNDDNDDNDEDDNDKDNDDDDDDHDDDDDDNNIFFMLIGYFSATGKKKTHTNDSSLKKVFVDRHPHVKITF